MNDTFEGQGNGTGRGEEENDEGQQILPWEFTILIVLALLIVVPNSFVLFLVTRKRFLRTATNLIFASLAVSDLLMGAFGIPLVVLSSTWPFSDTPLVYQSSAVFTKFISLSTVAHIFLHTCDRYVYILHALRYEDLVRPQRVYSVLAVTWLTTLFASCIRFAWVLGVDESEEAFVEMLRKDFIYSIFFLVVSFCLPLAVITTMDIHMLYIVHKQSQAIYQHNLNTEQRAQKSKRLVARERKSVLTCMLILLVYFFCWVPYSMLGVLPTDSVPLLWFIYFARFLSSLSNPWLYTLRKHDLRRATLRWCREVFPCIRERHRGRLSEDTARTELVEETTRV